MSVSGHTLRRCKPHGGAARTPCARNAAIDNVSGSAPYEFGQASTHPDSEPCPRSDIDRDAAGPWRVVELNGRNVLQEHRVVVGGDSVGVAFPTPQTFVNQDFLAVATGMNADRSHQRMTGGLAVAGHLAIDVFGVEAVRAVVALATAGHRGADELLAMPALEGLVRLRSWRAQDLSLALGTFRLALCRLAARLTFLGREIVTTEMVKIVVVCGVIEIPGSHVHVLRAVRMNRDDRD